MRIPNLGGQTKFMVFSVSGNLFHAPPLLADWTSEGWIYNRRQKLLRHSSFRGYFKLGSNMSPSPSPHGTMLCYFLLPKTLNNSGTTLIRGEGEGVPAKVLFRLFFL